MNLNSVDVKVYPSSLRNDKYDRNARLNSEYNITNLVNRLTGRDSFVIDGFTSLSTSGVLSPGEFNIRGYYFNILKEVDISSVTEGAVEGDVIYLEIDIKSMTVSNDIEFLQLKGFDTTESASTSVYDGLSIDKQSGGDLYPNNLRLPIFVFKNSAWVSLKTSRLSFDLDQLAVTNFDPSSNTSPKIMKDAGLSKNVSDAIIPLNDWLINDFIIDDGEI